MGDQKVFRAVIRFICAVSICFAGGVSADPSSKFSLGAAYINGDVNKLGFTYGLGAELFFIKPFSIESNFNQTLINNNSVNMFNTLLNYHKKEYKFTLGYEHLKIGSVEFSTFTTGVGISF